MNVLICSVARKVWLVNQFKQAAQRIGSKVWAADADPLAVGLRVADGHIALPRLDDPAYEATLLAACTSHQIRLIIPTRDGELAWFATRKTRFAAKGITVMVADPDVIELCQDKLAFTQFCDAAGFKVPSTVTRIEDAVHFPLFARPRMGAGGRGAGQINDAAALNHLVPWDDWLVQTKLDLPEFTLDLFADLHGKVISVIPRQRLRVAAGESVVGVTVDAPYLVQRAANLAERLGLIVHNTLQCFWDGLEPTWIEINPRFGGGAALGFAAGADTPAMLLDLIAGKVIPPQLGHYERDLYLFRHSTDLMVRGADL